MPTKTSTQLAIEFSDAVLAQDRCIAMGDAQAGNRHADEYVATAKELLERGDDGVNALETLLSHAEASVRVIAAAFLLEARTESAVAALRPIAAGSGLPALGAQMTLQRYERGDLRIR